MPRAVLAHSHVELPDAPLKLTRRIERSLRDGARIGVERSWEIAFTRQGQGIAIRGEQLHAAVEAPPALAALAAIERQRSTADMWPILLTPSGLILAAGNGVARDDVARAVEVASDMIAARTPSAARAEREIEYLGELSKAGSTLLDRLPDDLFYPAVGPVHVVRQVDLPGGIVGEFEVHYEASPAQGRQWLANARREIVTRIAGTRQSAREEWSLGSA